MFCLLTIVLRSSAILIFAGLKVILKFAIQQVSVFKLFNLNLLVALIAGFIIGKEQFIRTRETEFLGSYAFILFWHTIFLHFCFSGFPSGKLEG